MARQTVFFTGAGGFVGRHILTHYLAREDSDLYLLEHGAFCARLRAFVESRVKDPERRAHVRIIEGDITAPDLALDTSVAKKLKDSITRAIHLAAIYDLSVPRDVAFRVNVEGTRRVLEFLGGTKRLERFGYASTTAISGTFKGTYREEDFDVGQGFKNYYDETKFLAEKLVRERRDAIPTVILRPTVVVGDSKTGEFEKIDGPYFVLVAIARNMHLIVPDSGPAKCHAEPVDFVANAFYHLVEDDQSTGAVYQIADPNTITYNDFLALAAEHWGKMKPILKLPPALLKPLFMIPPVARLMGVTYEAFKYGHHPVEYDSTKADAVLKKYGITCPHISEYIDVMIRYFKEHYRDASIRRGKIYRTVQ